MNFHEINEGRPNPLAPDRSDHGSFKTITATSNNKRIKTSNNSVCKIYIYYTLIHVHDTQPCPQVYFVVSWLHFYQNIKFQMFIYFIPCVRKHVQSRKRYHNLKIHEIYLTPTYIY